MNFRHAHRIGRRALAGLIVAVIAVAGAVTVSPSPARADIKPSDFFSYAGYVKTGYSLFKQYVLGEPSETEQVISAVNQARDEIIAEVDRVATADVQACAKTHLEQFGNFLTRDHSNQVDFAMSAAECVNKAGALIDAEQSPAAIDAAGFALNAIGPVALAASAHVGEDWTPVRDDLIEANQRLQVRLQPTCRTTSSKEEAGGWQGIGQCYAYYRTRFDLPPTDGAGITSFIVHGAPGNPNLAIWPEITDYSQAITQAMALTSWAIAETAIDQLTPTAGPAGNPLAIATSAWHLNATHLFASSGTDQLMQASFDTRNSTFSGWSYDNDLRSVAATSTIDGRIEEFGITRAGRIRYRWQQVAGDDSSWAPWAEMDGVYNSVAAARNGNGTVQIFATNPQGQVFTRGQIMNGDYHPLVTPNPSTPAIDAWTAWRQLTSGMTKVAAVTDNLHQIEVWGVSAAGSVSFLRQAAENSTSFTGPTSIAGQLSDITATLAETSKVIVGGVDASGKVFYVEQPVHTASNDPAPSSNWQFVPGGMEHVALGRYNFYGDGEFDQGTLDDLMVGQAPGGKLYYARRDSSAGGAAWSAWRELDSLPGVKPIVGNTSGTAATADIAVIGKPGSTTIPVASSTGDGTFTTTNTDYAEFAWWAQLAGVTATAGDFNHDGRTDIALTGGQGWNTIPMATSNGDGTYTITNTSQPEFAGWASIPGVRTVAGDFNGDGRTDLALTGGPGWDTIPVALSTTAGNGTFTIANAKSPDFAASARADGAKPVVGDFNHDGRSDIALVGAAGANKIPIASGNANGTFTVTQFVMADFTWWAQLPNVTTTVGDFNGDGRADLALTGGAGWDTIPIAMSTTAGTGSFTLVNLKSPDFAGWAQASKAVTTATDVNGDGRTDLVLTGGAGWDTVPVATAHPSGDGGFDVTNGKQPEFAGWAQWPGATPLAADFTGDGRTDIALIGGAGWNTIPLAISTGDGLFRITNTSAALFGNLAQTVRVDP